VTHALKTFLIASICCALFTAFGSTLAAAQEYKIGVVDMQTVLAKYEKRKAKYDELQKRVDSLQAGIDAKSKAIEAAKADYDKKRKENKISSDELSALELKIRGDYVDYQAELTRNQQQIDSMEEEVLKEVLKDVQATVEKIATDENYHLILNHRSGPNSAVLYAATGIDITSKVLAQLNK
jgi:Skp family chaperone for outer membrane proteins